MVDKIKVIYDRWDPTEARVKHIEVNLETTPPFVYKTYIEGETLCQCNESILQVTARQAKKLFDFQKGSLDSCVRE